MPIPAGFDLETASLVEVKLLLVPYFLTKALTLAFALPLKQVKQDQVLIHPETYRPNIAASSSFSRLGPSRVTFPLPSLRNSMKAIEYTYMMITVRVGPMCKTEYMHSLVTTNSRQGTIPPSGESV